MQGPLDPVYSIAAVVLGAIGVAGWISLQVRFRKFARPYEQLAAAVDKEGHATALQTQLLGVERNQQRIEETMAYARRIHAQLESALQGVGFKKYDAFEDIRGTQSYSLCLLDVRANGVIITSIAGRNDYRGYAKPVKNGTCDLATSDEEKEVLEMAKQSLAGAPQAELVPA